MADKRLSDYEVEDRAKEAQSMLDSSVFKDAFDEVYSRSLSTLLAADVGSLTASAAHATMKALTDIKKQLGSFVNDDKMRQKYHRSPPEKMSSTSKGEH